MSLVKIFNVAQHTGYQRKHRYQYPKVIEFLKYITNQLILILYDQYNRNYDTVITTQKFQTLAPGYAQAAAHNLAEILNRISTLANEKRPRVHLRKKYPAGCPQDS